MITKIKTFTNLWLEWYEIIVEADSNNALPTIEIIWLPDAAIKESKERIRATFRNIWILMPPQKFILNLAPSDLKKVWTSFDLPMATALLKHIYENTNQDLEKFLFFWELGLDWHIKRVNWLLPSVISAIKRWYKDFVIPAENLYELEYIPDINIYPICNFSQVLDLISSNISLPKHTNSKNLEELTQEQSDFQIDFAHIKWHLVAKRAMSVAASWLHNILMVWAPGSGKTMLSKALQSVLPPLDFQEIIEVSQIYSVVGKLNKELPLITQRPFRQVHHTASKISIVWWWRDLTPWEVSLSHKWILFFDELTEFPREVLEVLRQPIEDKTINISRVSGSVCYPSNFMFVSSMNPCKCWYYKDPEKSCTCSINEIKRYQSKISGPLLDRIDMILEIPRENIDKLLSNIQTETSESIRAKVTQARQIQQKRFKNTKIFSNANMWPKDIEKYVFLDTTCKDFLRNATEKLNLSPRLIHRLIKLSRTIADMEQSTNIKISHLAESMQYRDKTMFVG